MFVYVIYGLLPEIRLMMMMIISLARIALHFVVLEVVFITDVVEHGCVPVFVFFLLCAKQPYT